MFKSVKPAGARELLQSDSEYIVVDVRTTEEFEAGHIPGAFNVPIAFAGVMGVSPNPDFADKIEALFPKDKKIVFSWKAGGRSQRACEMMSAAGYSKLVNMEGGYHGMPDRSGQIVEPGWAACGFETTTEAKPDRTWEALQGG